MDSKKIKVWAHRGASGYAPENTMDAFRKAIEMKADGIDHCPGDTRWRGGYPSCGTRP